MWAYTEVARDLTPPRFESTEDLDAYINAAFVGRHAVFALTDRLVITRWTPVEVKASILRSAIGFLQDIRRANARNDPAIEFRAELAGVAVETAELVEA